MAQSRPLETLSVAVTDSKLASNQIGVVDHSMGMSTRPAIVAGEGYGHSQNRRCRDVDVLIPADGRPGQLASQADRILRLFDHIPAIGGSSGKNKTELIKHCQEPQPHRHQDRQPSGDNCRAEDSEPPDQSTGRLERSPNQAGRHVSRDDGSNCGQHAKQSTHDGVSLPPAHGLDWRSRQGASCPWNLCLIGAGAGSEEQNAAPEWPNRADGRPTTVVTAGFWGRWSRGRFHNGPTRRPLPEGPACPP